MNIFVLDKVRGGISCFGPNRELVYEFEELCNTCIH